MKRSSRKSLAVAAARKTNRCLSCGTTENMSRRKYCSIACRQRLRYTLNIRTGLLKSLNARYATFYFTEAVTIMDVLCHGSREIFSYIYPRSPGKKPVEDFSRMADILGNAWWAERRRTNKKYLASRYVLEQANRNAPAGDAVKPSEIKNPTVIGTSLVHLKLDKAALYSSELQKKIKNAYRLQAKKHHPDLGGDKKSFMKIHRAYEELIQWAENPSFFTRRGFTDKWFYDGYTNKWVQPLPRQKQTV
ncbi:MAG: J domain-containing protein [Deltaproteobacteria bacterium]|nr:J domain-containing protein [Deltaproteobacteria bacterium]